MSLLPSCAARIPRSSGSLCALLLLLLLTPPGTLAGAGPQSARELRCVCVNIMPTIHPKIISNMQIIPAGPQCPEAEIIVTLKNGMEVCLDPQSSVVKKTIQKMLNSRKLKN